MKIVVIDIETTGSNCLKNEMVCFGVVIVDLMHNRKVSSGDFYLLPMKENYVWEQRCLDEFWDKPENIEMKREMLRKAEVRGAYSSVAMNAFYQWVLKHTAGSEAVVFFDTAGFDVTFMNVYMSRAGLPSMDYIFGSYQPVRDSSSFHAGVAKCLPTDGMWGMEKQAIKTLGGDVDTLGKNPHAANHDPLSDAHSIAWDIMLVAKRINMFKGKEVDSGNESFCKLV